MARILDLLEGQTDRMRQGLEPNYELLIEIAEYFRSFPDLYHHPKEELIIDYLLIRQAPGAAELQRLTLEHEEGSNELSRFCRTLIYLLMEPERGRADFLEASQVFLEQERRHVTWEDERFFEIAEAGLAKADWTEIEVKIARLRYAVFEREALSRFTLLGKALERSHKQPAT